MEQHKDPFEEWKNFYNVLLIEEKEGISYRQGLGRMSVVNWERLDLEQKDVILG